METITVNTKEQSLKDVAIGQNVIIYNFVNAYGCSIGDGSKVGCFVEIQKGATIGKNCKISSHSFICEGVHISDNVFIGHNVTFINDKYPRAINDEGTLQSKEDWDCIETHVDEGVSIGSSATILCGICIGKGSIIGAGSVVTRNVPPHVIVAGNPARIMKSLPLKS